VVVAAGDDGADGVSDADEGVLGLSLAAGGETTGAG
jgi:hypothetical protein